MKIRAKIDLDEFFAVVDKCDGKVELVTDEGDRYNLSSRISQCVAVSKFFSGGEDVPGLRIVASNSEDAKKIMAFLENVG